MAEEVERRIVEMKFDNKEFEKNIETSLKSLSELNKKLDDFKGVDFANQLKGFESFASLGSKLANPFEALTDTVGAFADKFSFIHRTIARQVDQLANDVINKSKAMVSSLTMDQVGAGWDKYADKTSAVQTIMAATAKDFTDTGEQMEYVNAQLDKLNWFTDETSYNFLDMVSNVGKFTSNAIPLEKSVTAMQGIATWAAISGANANEASRAMYNMAQAIGTGSVKLLDWRSIESANMHTAEFKTTAMETAVALGTLSKSADGVYKTLKGNAVSIQDFNSALTDGWFTADVLMDTLKQYGGFADALYTASDKLGYTATELLGYIQDYQNGTLSLSQIAAETGATQGELSAIFENLASDTYDLGRRAFIAAQEAKTFQEALNSVKDAVSTGWMNTFELIFGNYEEAKVLWTDLANTLYEVFAEAGNERNEMLKAWREGGGRESALNGIVSLYEALTGVTSVLKESFRSLFPATTADTLLDWTHKFEDFASVLSDVFFYKEEKPTLITDLDSVETKRLTVTRLSTTLEKLERIFNGLFSGARIGVDAFKSLGSAIFSTFGLVTEKLPKGGVLEFLAKLGDKIVEIRENLEESNFFETWYENASPYLQGLVDSLFEFGGAIKDFLLTLKNQALESGVFTAFTDAFSSLFTAIASKVPNGISYLSRYFSNLVSWAKESGLVKAAFSKLVDIFKKIQEYAPTAVENFGNFIKTTLESLKDSERVQKGLEKTKTFFSNFLGALRGFYQGVKTIIEEYKEGIAEGAYTSIFDFIKKKSKTENGLLGYFSDIFSKLGEEWIKSVEYFKGVGSDFISKLSAVITFFYKGFQKIKEFFSNVAIFGKDSIEWIIRIFKGVAIIGLIRSFSKIGNSIASFVKRLGKTTTVVGNGLSAFLKGLVREEEKKDTFGTTMLKLAGAAVLFAAALSVMSKIDPERLSDSLLILTKIIVSMGLFGAIMSKLDTKFFKGFAKIGESFLKLAASIGVLLLAIWGLSKIKPDVFLDGLLKLGGILVELAIFSKIAGKGFTPGTGGGFLGLATGILILIQALKQLSKMEPAVLAKGLMALLPLLLEMGLFTRLTSKSFKFSNGLALAGIAASLLAMIKVMEKIALMDPDDISKGLKTIGVLGLELGALARLSSSFGILNALGLLLTVGGLMVEFSMMMDHFKDMNPDQLTTITDSFMKVVGTLGAVMTAAGLVGGMNVASGGAAIAIVSSLVLALAGFVSNIQGSQEFLDGAADILEKAGTTLGSLVGAFAGTVADFTLAGVGAGLSAFWENGEAFFTGIQDLDENSVAAAEALAGMVGALTVNDLVSGLKQLLGLGTTDFEKFAQNLEPVGNGLAKFSNAVSGKIDSESASAAGAVADMIIAFWKDIPPTGGKLQELIGEKKLDAFSKELPGLGTNLASFAANVSGIETGSAKKAAEVAGMITAFWKELPETGGWIQDLFGEKDIWSFANALPNLGSKLKAFATNISGVEFGSSEKAGEVASILATTYSALTADAGFIPDLLGSKSNSLSTFARNVGLVGSGLRSFANSVKDFEVGNTETALSVAEDLSAFQAEFDKEGGFLDFIIGSKGDSFSTFNENLTALGGALSSLGVGIKSLDGIDSMDPIIRSMRDLVNFSTGEDVNNSLWVMRDLADYLGSIGSEGFTGFVSAFVDSDGVLKGNGSTLVDSLVEGIKEKFPDVSSYGHNLVIEFGSAIDTYKTSATIPARNLVISCINELNLYVGRAYKSGLNFSSGFAQGIKSGERLAIDASSSMGDNTIAALNRSLEERSPSKAAFRSGDYFDRGLANGMIAGFKHVLSATEFVGNETISAFDSAMGIIKVLSEDAIDLNPVITPVLDLSQLTEEAKTINPLLINQNGIPVTGLNLSAIGAIAPLPGSLSSSSEIRVNNSDVVEAINDLSSKFEDLSSAVQNMKLYLDSGRLVGELTPAIDRQLGSLAGYKK